MALQVKGLKEKPNTKNENKAQNKPAKTTVVNLGVCRFPSNSNRI
jgi:hypothetical protein